MNVPLDDIDRIMAIMDRAFDPAFGEAWNRRQIEDALLIGNCTYDLIARHGEAPAEGEPAAGFSLTRQGYEEVELLLLAVDPARRGRGLGSKLLSRLSVRARSIGAHRVLLEMRRGNPAESLYSAHGFQPIGMRPNYYRTPAGERIDAITFSCAL